MPRRTIDQLYCQCNTHAQSADERYLRMNDVMETPNPASPFAIARKAMVDSQLRTSGVNEPFVLARMGVVPREDFVPQDARGSAYIDRSVPLANGRRMAAPVFYGMLLAEAQPQLEDDVLIIDAGSGYLAALVEPLVTRVESITPEQALKTARGAQPVSLILVDGAIEHVPPALARRLHPMAASSPGWSKAASPASPPDGKRATARAWRCCRWAKPPSRALPNSTARKPGASEHGAASAPRCRLGELRDSAANRRTGRYAARGAGRRLPQQPDAGSCPRTAARHRRRRADRTRRRIARRGGGCDLYRIPADLLQQFHRAIA